MPSQKDLVGVKFVHWTVTGAAPTKKGERYWLCRCKCGREKEVAIKSLRRGKSISCGCSKRTHFATKTTEYFIWAGMIERCSNPKHSSWPRYGGRGIKVCERWRKDFTAFLSDVGPRPSKAHTLDRYPDPDGPYSPENIRWATWQQQAHSKDSTRMYTFQGKTLCASEWSRLLGLTESGVTARIDRLGWSVEEALSVPAFGRRH